MVKERWREEEKTVVVKRRCVTVFSTGVPVVSDVSVDPSSVSMLGEGSLSDSGCETVKSRSFFSPESVKPTLWKVKET